ncbi:hypothetical protein DI09_62p30 [Mitosporidium daphniae]|uniref:M-phase inducer phosphatase n=1 Tax=Mitosporidium daphniae TaxID=1485682 RepID=A0A098VP65_9MICR|nr:uncharacterized protein DI09_62p30 [Mitosporidium daphniae]KGG50599.1 hypothetical protein DI09_62p30 [Mitosporidium daphniae]|eukprot:XP_013237043.1 uncharacterized protein DI09_62p30 [Mitosporidium daphniae]
MASPSARKRCIPEAELINRTTLLSHWSITKSAPLFAKCSSSLPSLCTPEDSPKSTLDTLFAYFRRSSPKSPITGVSCNASEETLIPLRPISMNLTHAMTPEMSPSKAEAGTMHLQQNFGIPAKLAAKAVSQSIALPRYAKSLTRSPLKTATQRKVVRPACRSPMPRRLISSLDNYATPSCVELQDEAIPLGLPILDVRSKEAIPRISPETLASLLEGEYATTYSTIHIIDARFPYEYHGGHVAGALSCSSTNTLESIFFNETILNQQDAVQNRTAIIFHCEFSSHRAPSLALFMRKRDRSLNAYPKLFYPELYILHGGYREFFRRYVGYCQPPQYRQMHDPAFKDELRIEMRLFRAASARHARHSFLLDPAIEDPTSEEEDDHSLSLAFDAS